MLYSAAALALQRNWGKKQEAIRRLFELSLQVWKDCARDHDSSMIMMCEEETGIEIRNGDGKSWRDVSYLNGCMNPGRMTGAQLLYMRQQQIKWVRPQVMACLMVAMHRKYGFGYERLSRIYAQMQEIEADYNMDPKLIWEACLQETRINVVDVVTGNDS